MVTTLKTSVSEEYAAAVRRKNVNIVVHRLCPEGLVLEYGAATRVLGAAGAPPSDEVAAEQAPATKRAKKKHGPQMCHYAKVACPEIGQDPLKVAFASSLNLQRKHFP